MILLEVTLLLV